MMPDPAPWAERFPHRRHLWAGPIRVWRVEGPDRHQSRIATWVARAAALGLAEPGAAAVLAEATALRPARRTTTYLDLPNGPYPATVNAQLPEWPAVTPADVPAAFRASVATFQDVPIVRAERLTAIAVDSGDGIEVYDADHPDALVARVPHSAVTVPGPDEWTRAWQSQAAGEWASAEVVYADGIVRVKRMAEGDAPLTWLWTEGDALRAGAEVRVG
jgi:hypothetical protein